MPQGVDEFVLDRSVTLAWGMADETSENARQVFDALGVGRAVAPPCGRWN